MLFQINLKALAPVIFAKGLVSEVVNVKITWQLFSLPIGNFPMSSIPYLTNISPRELPWHNCEALAIVALLHEV